MPWLPPKLFEPKTGWEKPRYEIFTWPRLSEVKPTFPEANPVEVSKELSQGEIDSIVRKLHLGLAVRMDLLLDKGLKDPEEIERQLFGNILIIGPLGVFIKKMAGRARYGKRQSHENNQGALRIRSGRLRLRRSF